MRGIGFVGLGIMGTPMVKNLAKKFSEINVYDVDSLKVKELISFLKPGAVIQAESIAKLGEKSDIVFLSLPNSAVVKQVVNGDHGLSSSLKSGSIVIDTSTTDTAVVLELSAILMEKGIRFLDAPLSGGQKGAVEGNLSIMVGGDETVFKSCLEYLNAIGASVIRTGGTGSGQVAKCVNQMIVSATFAVIAESFALGAKAGLDPQTLYNAIKGGWAGSKVLDVCAQDLSSREFKPGGTIDLLCKDLSYSLSLARNQGFPAPVTALVNEIFVAAKAAGDGKQSQTAIIKLWENILKIEVK
ncbi:MAG: NAD(P)-binding domain-containing protein [Treponemataceae bacterium]